MLHVRETGEVHTGFWWGNLRECDMLEDVGVNGTVVFTIDLQEFGWGGGLD